ncbi:DnaJ-domain-containing protein [Exidia glandulosa HHB12029]|uniref:DnaJ-domain-containing protein n=1 Tax=Exidia glandulosa HHB12029 TaxID=1314781 RepID=A0A165Q6C0_EXIGL|nr:DnaJ-domain-containing protein [Exidia glandulosa HHB12029]
MSSPLPTRRVAPHTQLYCNQCKTLIEFATPSAPAAGNVQVQCCQCGTVQPASGSSSTTQHQQPGKPKRGRKIGTQEKPLDMTYYDLLGVPVSATTDDIKKAYRRLAIKFHPDKNRDDPDAEEKFKMIAIAYQTLSDADLRRKYNEFGPKESAPEGGFVDPEEVFGAIFGGERFVPIIGHISLARDMKSAMQEVDEDEEGAGTAVTGSSGPSSPRLGKDGKPQLSPEEKARKDEKARAIAAERAKHREERVSQLVENLDRKLSVYTEAANGFNDREVTDSWRKICQLEADELKRESYGIELLHTIGFVYAAKAKHFLASSESFMGVGGWLHNVQGKYHVFSETVSTVRSALEVKSVFEQLAAAEKAGATPEEKRKLEEQAAEKGLQALFKGTKLEIESILRETCDRILEQPAVPVHKLKLRAQALQILGEAYAGVRKDGAEEDDYVRIDTRSSKARESYHA